MQRIVIYSALESVIVGVLDPRGNGAITKHI